MNNICRGGAHFPLLQHSFYFKFLFIVAYVYMPRLRGVNYFTRQRERERERPPAHWKPKSGGPLTWFDSGEQWNRGDAAAFWKGRRSIEWIEMALLLSRPTWVASHHHLKFKFWIPIAHRSCSSSPIFVYLPCSRIGRGGGSIQI